ncbi:MAG: TonB-dependent receptor [Candidatus Rokubacteria bacterium]|nr:TonB-dependent receptor [Candidatus Rokubacteria bacterium]
MTGWVELEDGRADEAVTRFTRVAPPSVSSLLGLALAHFRRGDFAASTAVLAAATRRFGPTPAVLTHGALLDLLQGEVARARQAIDEALRLDPDFAPALGLRSNVALTQNRKADALGDGRHAVAANPYSPSAQLDLALALQAHFQLDAALEAARRAVALDPRNVRTRIHVARLLLGFDRVEDATREAQEARALDPAEPLVLATLGFIHLIRGETADAVAAFEAALDAGSTSGDPYLGLGLAAFRQGRREEGLRAFQAATALEPRVSLFQSYLGKALWQVERREEALGTLDRARTLDPRDPTPDLYAGVFLTDLNRPADAMVALQRSVALNDNRAVFRSRLLLDRDLATRNVDLSRAYVALGQADRTRAVGIRALHEDPQSSSTHLLYASALRALNAIQPANSELLVTRLLLPVNQLAFNTFNDYTSLLEAPRLQGTLEGTVGSFDTREGSVVLFGGTTRVAASTVVTYSRTEGPKPANSDDENWATLTLLKWAPTLRSSAFVQLFHAADRGGDTFANQRGFTPNDPDFRKDARSTLLELGYQLELQPGHTLLLAVQRQYDRLKSRDQTVSLSPTSIAPQLFPDLAIRSTTLLDLATREPFSDVQSAYLGRVGSHQLWLAADYFRGRPESRQRIQSLTDLVLFGAPVPGFSVATDDFQKNWFTREYLSFVAQDTWQPHPSLYLTGALRYDHGRDGDRFGPLRQDSSLLSPQAGLLWRVTPDHTLRLAAFRAVQTHTASRVFPTQVAGFFINAPVDPSTDSTQYHAAWDADLGPMTFLTLDVFRRAANSPTFTFAPDGMRVRETVTRHRTGGSAALNQVFARYWGASVAYLRVHREDPGSEGDDDLVQLGLRFVHPSGLSAQASVAYVQQDLAADRPSGAPRDFWVVSLTGRYEFPRKWGALTVGIENVFDKRFDLRGDPLGRDVATIVELPERRVFATLSVNF